MKRSTVYLNLVLSIALLSGASVAGKLPSDYLRSFAHIGDPFEAQQQDATLFADAGTPQLRQQLARDRYVEQATKEYQHRQGIRSVTYTVVTSERDGNPGMTVNVDMVLSADSTRALVIMDNKEQSIIIDYPECFPDENQKAGKEDMLEEIAESLARRGTNTWVHLPYDRFDIYIDSAFYNQHTPRINDFFNKFEPRYELLETLTNWNAEELAGNRLIMYVEPTLSACASGYAAWATGEVNLFLYENFTYQTESDICKRPYYIDGEEYYDNPGELGDHWIYMKTPLHESIHIINPEPIWHKSWLTNGFAEYYGYNILSMFNDINQETANTYIYEKDSTAYNWPDYTSNDYKDYYNNEIQMSGGYTITAWMFSMLRDNYLLDWDDFYFIINNNLETLDTSQDIDGTPPQWDSIFTDTYIIYVFGKALGMSFNDIQEVFRYDGPSGPGWGVRQWETLDWYADLAADLPADTALLPGETLPLTIHNDGAVFLENVYTALYVNDSLIWSDSLAFADSATTVIDLAHGLPTGTYALTLTVDEDNLKIETDDTNNSDSMNLVIDCCLPPIRGNVDYDPGDAIDISDLVYLVDYMFNSGPEPPCLSESDIDASGGESPIDISDLVYLVDYMFSGGPEPVECP